MQSGQSPAPPAQAQQSGAAVPSPAPNQGSPQSAQAGSGGRPGWQIAVIVIAVVVGVFLAVNAVLIPYVLVSVGSVALSHATFGSAQDIQLLLFQGIIWAAM